tara:strand:- start:362 stop:730 length:369 start_codon:yes stop_codon:yes gene_type:complete
MTRRRRTSNRTQRHRKKVSKKYRTKKYQRVRIQKKSKTSRKTRRRRRRRKTFKKGGFIKTMKSLGEGVRGLSERLTKTKENQTLREELAECKRKLGSSVDTAVKADWEMGRLSPQFNRRVGS